MIPYNFSSYLITKAKGGYGLYRWIVNNSKSLDHYADEAYHRDRNRKNVGNKEVNDIYVATCKKLFETANEYRSFILYKEDTSKLPQDIASATFLNEKEISLPFSRVFIEIQGVGLPPRPDGLDPILIGAFFDEASPGVIYSMNIFSMLDHKAQQYYFSIEHGGLIRLGENKDNFSGSLILKAFHNYQLDKQAKSGRCVAKEKTRHGREKIIDYVFCKKTETINAERDISVKIDWKHRWEVMGHWRKHNGIGKDREGVRSVEGFTWVVPHEKGAKDMPVIKKERIFQNSQGNEYS